jgi:hypothetical protein
LYIELSLSFDVFITYKLNKDTKKSIVESSAEDNKARLPDISHTTVFIIISITAVIFAIIIGLITPLVSVFILSKKKISFHNDKDFLFKSNF